MLVAITDGSELHKTMRQTNYSYPCKRLEKGIFCASQPKRAHRKFSPERIARGGYDRIMGCTRITRAQNFV